jgi:hypothetical protein
MTSSFKDPGPAIWHNYTTCFFKDLVTFLLQNIATKKKHVKLNTGLNEPSEVVWTKFPGLQTDKNLNWKTHNEYIVHKPSSAVTSIMKIYK